MKNALIFITLLIAAALAWSCGQDGAAEEAEQNFTAAAGMYYGAAVSVPADSVVLTFEAGTFNNGNPSGEAKRLTITCLVPSMFDEIYLNDGDYTAAEEGSRPPVFVPGALDPYGFPGGTYLESWGRANDRTLTLFTGGSLQVAYSDKTEQYIITASLTDAEGRALVTTYIGKLDLSLPEIDYDERLNNLVAGYYGDGNSAAPQRWVLDVFRDEAASGGYTGIFLDIHASRTFMTDGAGDNTLQEGEYRLGSGDATGTYAPGAYENGRHTGSYYYRMDASQGLLGGIYITGGTFSISRNAAAGSYTLTANLRGRNIDTDAEETKTLIYTGIPVYLNMNEALSGSEAGSSGGAMPVKYLQNRAGSRSEKQLLPYPTSK